MHKTIRYGFLVVLLTASLFISSAFAQMKIAETTGTPNSGAMLDVESSNRGFLLPRVSLTGLTMRLNGVVPIEGTMIFSTNSTGEGSLGGTFIWKGGAWVALNDSQQITTSQIRLTPGRASLVNGDVDVYWDGTERVSQPSGDAAMWTSANPTKVIIRRKGWYFVSGSVLITARRARPYFLSIGHKGLKVAPHGFITPGTAGGTNRLTLNTSAMLLCDVNDEITLICTADLSASANPGTYTTTQFSVTQLPTQTL
ncbi:hypothetical protein G6M26_27255 [Agrobacterium tumefaciens]|nr:hypothetical protein [Agrobacterium tumefaciens]NTE22253.1 hypothetical protein [Agrobacterium tumefaciens]